MPQNFIECGREQAFLMPPSLLDWVPDDHLVWTVLDAVAEVDLGAFYADYRADGHGRPAYEPAMMGWIRLVVATLNVEELRCRQETPLWIVPLRQGTSACWAERASGPVLGGDRSRGVERTRRRGGGCPAEHWCPLVPQGWRNAASHARAGIRALSVLPRAGGDRGSSRWWFWGARDRASAGSRTVDDLPGAAAKRCAADRSA